MATQNTHEHDSASLWGDFVDSDDEGEVEDECEPVERYMEGLYYPICLGEILADRYRIEHKLGHGGFSTVWMAYDMLDEKDVALKILTTEEAGEREYAMQKEISSLIKDTSHLLIYQDTFLLPGTGGRQHRVFKFPLLGPPLRSWKHKPPTATRRIAAKQLLQAIKALHDAGIVHRDLNSANVMYGLAPFEKGTSVATKYQHLGRPRKISISRYDPLWKEGQLVEPMNPDVSLVEERIFLGDFGISIKAGTPVNCKIQSPFIYCAPERFHDKDPSYASDMWSYMCIFAELFLGFPLFPDRGPSSTTDFMVAVLGPLPSSWKGAYNGGGEERESWYDPKTLPVSRLTLESKVTHSSNDISPAEKQLALSILKSCLSYEPEHRLTAGQLLKSAAFKDFMKIYGL
ncbi:CMGC protein kinase [Fusarium austroafricanum]|uniref:CMGC protein kinase n=1 Tax=Fusarium austroafricanum TaxID=2364996 RepID=A0A8H4K8Y3_9HYPO|nr:CMGC protein kinase [Fusarium austroafricanum]